AYSPDGTTVLTASGDCTARLWDVNTGQQLHILQGHTYAVSSVACSPDGKILITCSNDNTTRLWDVITGQQLHILGEHTQAVTSVAYSPDGKTILTGFNDNTARLWDIKTGQQLHILQGHTDTVISVAYSPDGKILLTCSDDNTTRLWAVESESKAVDWITKEINPFQAWLIVQAAQAKRAQGVYNILKDTVEYKIFMTMPSHVREYIQRWYFTNRG
ncbi:WD40 repeat domain-containing protein, partial [Candidatus Dependentiae bacterium]|nr:WD40 repeat domain-containing protein [Candidatus Dependentiae bacterium]